MAKITKELLKMLDRGNYSYKIYLDDVNAVDKEERKELEKIKYNARKFSNIYLT